MNREFSSEFASLLDVRICRERHRAVELRSQRKDGAQDEREKDLGPCFEECLPFCSRILILERGSLDDTCQAAFLFDISLRR